MRTLHLGLILVFSLATLVACGESDVGSDGTAGAGGAASSATSTGIGGGGATSSPASSTSTGAGGCEGGAGGATGAGGACSGYTVTLIEPSPCATEISPGDPITIEWSSIPPDRYVSMLEGGANVQDTMQTSSGLQDTFSMISNQV